MKRIKTENGTVEYDENKEAYVDDNGTRYKINGKYISGKLKGENAQVCWDTTKEWNELKDEMECPHKDKKCVGKNCAAYKERAIYYCEINNHFCEDYICVENYIKHFITNIRYVCANNRKCKNIVTQWSCGMLKKDIWHTKE